MEYEVSRVLTCKLPPHQQDRHGSLSCSVFLIKEKKISFLPQPAMPFPTDAFPTKRTSIFYLPWQVSTCFPIPPSAAWLPSPTRLAAHVSCRLWSCPLFRKGVPPSYQKRKAPLSGGGSQNMQGGVYSYLICFAWIHIRRRKICLLWKECIDNISNDIPFKV